MDDTIKVIFLMMLFLVFAPAAGYLIRGFPPLQRLAFFLMVFLSVGHVDYVMMSPGFGDFYRGHTRGYEFTLMEAMAVVLLFAGRGRPQEQGRWLPPGAGLWLVYCLVASFSIFNSANANYTMMAIVKYVKILVIFMATFHFLREESDLHFWLKTIAILLIFQSVLALYQKYVEGSYPVEAWFEHQNPFGMYSYLLALPLLAAGLAAARGTQTAWYLSGFIGGTICVQSSFSRAALVCFAVGICMVVLLSLVARITLKRVVVIVVLGVLGLIASIPAADTVIARFNDQFNTSSSETRHTLNLCSRRMIKEYPIFGTGWNTYGIMINPPYTYGDPFFDLTHSRKHKVDRKRPVDRTISESWYYLMLAETGLAGTAAMFVFFLTMLYWCGRAMLADRNRFPSAVAIGLFSALSVTYLQSNYERVLTQPKNLTAWMICLGVVARLEWWRRNPVTRFQSIAGNPGGAAPAITQPAGQRPAIIIPPPDHLRRHLDPPR
jgi:hypothetical protein